MPRLRCPRCATVIDVAAGARPVCVACGFGAAAPPAPAPPPPNGLAAPAAAGGPPRKASVVAIVLVGVLVLAGAAAAVAYFALRVEEPRALTEEEARSRVEASLQAAGDALVGNAGDGDLRKVTIEATPPESPPSGPQDLFGGLGMGDMTMTIEYGRDGAVRFALDMQSGAVTVAFTMVCTPERQFIIAGGQTYGSRPAAEPTPDACRDIGEAFGEDGFGEAVPPMEELETEAAEIERRGDGSVRAVIEDDGVHVVVEIDAQGRVRSMAATEPEGVVMTMTFEYGPRSVIATPAEYELMPASVEFGQEWEGAEQTWTVAESREEPPLGDFEVRIQDYDFDFSGDGTAADVARAVFALEDGTTQTEGNLTFRFEDADDDGKLTAGDSFVVRDLDGEGGPAPPPPGPPEEPEEPCDPYGSEPCDDPCDPESSCEPGYGDFDFDFGVSSYQVVVYDLVADGEVNSGFAEAPAPAWLALAALAVAGAVSRRR